MMSNVLAATYPEQIQALSLYSGVPAGCFLSSSGGVDQWNSSCASGQVSATADAWGNIARNMYPGYNGTRPRIQIWHGSADSTLNPQNYREEIKVSKARDPDHCFLSYHGGTRALPSLLNLGTRGRLSGAESALCFLLLHMKGAAWFLTWNTTAMDECLWRQPDAHFLGQELPTAELPN